MTLLLRRPQTVDRQGSIVVRARCEHCEPRRFLATGVALESRRGEADRRVTAVSSLAETADTQPGGAVGPSDLAVREAPELAGRRDQR